MTYSKLLVTPKRCFSTIPYLINQSNNLRQLITHVKTSEIAEISVGIEGNARRNGGFDLNYDFDLGLLPIDEYLIFKVVGITLSQVSCV